MTDALIPDPQFQMQSYRTAERVWVPMESGPAKSTWRPRKTREDAVLKCLTWTGVCCIPAMRVLDLSTGVVIWQDRYEADPDDRHLDRIVASWAEPLYEQARRDLAGVDEVIGRAVDEFKPAPEVEDAAALFDLADFEGSMT